MKKLDLSGQRFGKLLVVKDSDRVSPKGHRIYVDCICDCGNTTTLCKMSLKKENGTKSCGCLSKKYFIDLTGQKFNNLTLTTYLGKDNSKNNVYRATCDCGGSIIVQGSDAKTGKIQSCGCKYFTKQVATAKARGLEGLYKQLFAGYKGAPRRGYSFNLDYEWFKLEIVKNCHYCNSVPQNTKVHKQSYGDLILLYNGLDRVNNDIGYEPENCVPCCRSCNIAKHTYSAGHFKEMVTNIYNHYVKPKED